MGADVAAVGRREGVSAAGRVPGSSPAGRRGGSVLGHSCPWAPARLWGLLTTCASLRKLLGNVHAVQAPAWWQNVSKTAGNLTKMNTEPKLELLAVQRRER